MMKKNEFLKKVNCLILYKKNKIIREIFNEYCQYVDCEDALVTSLVQTPFLVTKDLKKIKKEFGENVLNNIKILNRINKMDASIHDNCDKYYKMILLFLINCKILITRSKKLDKTEDLLNPRKASYTQTLLSEIRIDQLRYDIEGKLFRITDPEIYKNYKDLLKFSKVTYQNIENEIKNEIKKRLKNENIKADIESRFKSIYSIHRKIINRNILFSQVLDIIGFRIITKSNDKNECYKIMEYLLNTWPVLNNKIKDFISVPKSNGYQSIHLTVMFDHHPVELQIRTKEMHMRALYGSASHNIYKVENQSSIF